MDTAIKHPVLDRVKPSFVIFDIRALWRSGLGLKGLRIYSLTAFETVLCVWSGGGPAVNDS